ncbi:Uncharacterized conserved protein YlxW, UPF0749 family [Parageobacillus thermantarcticus]|uniref:Uncharacterized conserved protein YlxW, UPF0749 family n=1 Tax=Parageobacillus thermantarcticus TaxID=186116 RepID=A0A1I0T462_9BACL|nr:DUF881 domain-containing protein [Parageobacillus thermantarcticus]SFA46487.1 Uncharacterized conserved protein YlxW, UPF0749 family [Parageobacillus thermantarcticus]
MVRWLERKKTIYFTCITAIFGFMLAVQLHTTSHPKVRDTRDIWELRADLKKEQQLQRQLLSDIEKYEEKMRSYQQKQSARKEAVLRETVSELQKEAGLTEVKGAGLVLTIQSFYPDNYTGPITETVSPELLQRLINELNMYGAKEIAVAEERMTNTTAIRDVNGATKIGDRKISSLPIEVKVIADDAEMLYNRLNVSTIRDDFAVENLQLVVSKPLASVVVPPSEKNRSVKYMEAAIAEKEEK